MVDAVSKAFFQSLSRSQTLKTLASRHGMTGRRAFARRFIAGEDLPTAIAALQDIRSQGLHSTLDYLGESVTSRAAAKNATREYLVLVEAIDAAGAERNLSVKPTQLGLDIDRSLCHEHLTAILDAAGPCGFFVRIDMESSRYTDATLDIFESVWRAGHRGVGVVLQSALYRTPDDLERVIALGARVRLVKGAYREAAGVAYQRKADVDAAYLTLAHRLLDAGRYPAIATHDHRLIGEVKAYARQAALPADRFEFQMLYGIRRDLQMALRDEGYRMRIYVPFGKEWFPYFMRRLGERPANVWFVVRSLIAEERPA